MFALTVAWGDEKIVSKGCCCANAQVLNQIKLALIDIEVSFEMFIRKEVTRVRGNTS